MFTLCHLQEWHWGARQVDPRRSGILSYITTLRKTFGCAILRSCLRVSPTPMRIRRSSPNNAGGCAAVLSSPPPGAVKTPTNQVNCNVPYNFPRMSIRLRSSRCGTHHNCRDQACASLLVARTCQSSLAFPPEPMLEGPRKTIRRLVLRLVTGQVCQGFVLVFAEFFPLFSSGFSQWIFCTNVFQVFPFAQTCPPGNVSFWWWNGAVQLFVAVVF